MVMCIVLTAWIFCLPPRASMFFAMRSSTLGASAVLAASEVLDGPSALAASAGLAGASDLAGASVLGASADLEAPPCAKARGARPRNETTISHFRGDMNILFSGN